MSLHTIFYHLLNMSLTASVLGIAVLLLRRMPGLPRRWVLWGWLVVGLRLTVPFLLQSPYSALGLLGGFIRRVVPLPAAPEALGFANAIGTAQTYAPVRQATIWAEAFFGTAAVIWAVSAVLGLGAVGVLHAWTHRRLAGQVRLREGRWVADSLQTPLVMGLFRQRLVEPASLDADAWELACAQRHEVAHMRRHDNLLRLVAIVLAVLHWFNPVVWVYLGLFLRDLELACDEAAVSGLPDAERTRYAKALVNLGAGHAVYPDPMGLGTAGIAFGEGKLGGRVRAVLAGKPLRGPLAVLAVLLLVLLGVAMLTNPMSGGKPAATGSGAGPTVSGAVPAGSAPTASSIDRTGALPTVRVMEMISSTMPEYIHPKGGIGEGAARALCAEWISGWMEKGGASNPNLDGLTLREHTLQAGWDNGRLQLFGVSGFAMNDGYAVFQDGKLQALLPGMGVMSAWLSDQDADGHYEFYTNAGFGSGIVNEEIHCFDPQSGKTWSMSERGERDFFLFLRDGRLVVRVIPYTASGPDPDRSNEFRELMLTEEGLMLGAEVNLLSR